MALLSRTGVGEDTAPGFVRADAGAVDFLGRITIPASGTYTIAFVPGVTNANVVVKGTAYAANTDYAAAVVVSANGGSTVTLGTKSTDSVTFTGAAGVSAIVVVG